VRDAQNRVVLNGQFAPVPADEADEDEIERVATMQPTGVDNDASGEAEIEFFRENPPSQEVEFSGRNLERGVMYSLTVDGQQIASAAADANGRVEVEVDVPIPGASTAGAR
jgi:hypothetical protein